MEDVDKKLRKGAIFNFLPDLFFALSGRRLREWGLSEGERSKLRALQDVSFEVSSLRHKFN